jgi:hypothetical protein
MQIDQGDGELFAPAVCDSLAHCEVEVYTGADAVGDGVAAAAADGLAAGLVAAFGDVDADGVPPGVGVVAASRP